MPGTTCHRLGLLDRSFPNVNEVLWKVFGLVRMQLGSRDSVMANSGSGIFDNVMKIDGFCE